MCHELVGGGLIEDGGIGDVDDGGKFRLLRKPVRPTILQHIIIGVGKKELTMIVNPESYEDDFEDGVPEFMLSCLTLHQLVFPILVFILKDQPFSFLDVSAHQFDLLLFFRGQSDDCACS